MYHTLINVNTLSHNFVFVIQCESKIYLELSMLIREILKNIFSITDYGATHHKITLCGIRFKFPRVEYSKKRKTNLYYFYKKNNVDITTIPPAQGQVRDIQLANLALLQELDYVCQESNLKYWIDFGTLLGAIRHKGFIPWDDDIDVGMLRQDYEKIIAAFEKYSRNTNIYADFVRSAKNTCQYYIKIQHRKCQNLFVDIFPYDFYGDCLSKEEQLKITLKIKGIRKSLQRHCKLGMPDKEIKDAIDASLKKVILKERKTEKSDLVWGLDFNHGWKNWLYNYDTIFPLNKIEFEGKMFKCINKPEEFLKEVYGDYMAYPNKIGVGHSMYAYLGSEEKQAIEELIQVLR